MPDEHAAALNEEDLGKESVKVRKPAPKEQVVSEWRPQFASYAERIRSAGSIKKITKAQELIATSRIGKAQARLQAARPYAYEITDVLTDAGDAERAGPSAARRA